MGKINYNCLNVVEFTMLFMGKIKLSINGTSLEKNTYFYGYGLNGLNHHLINEKKQLHCSTVNGHVNVQLLMLVYLMVI